MGDAYSGVDGSLWHRNIEDKFEQIRTLIAEVLTEEPQLVLKMRQEVDKILKHFTMAKWITEKIDGKIIKRLVFPDKLITKFQEQDSKE